MYRAKRALPLRAGHGVTATVHVLQVAFKSTGHSVTVPAWARQGGHSDIPPVRGDMQLLGQVQQRVTKMIDGLNRLLKGKLSGLGQP